MVLAQTSPTERPLLQRAVDEALQRQQEEEAGDAAVLHLHSLQRQLADLEHQAEQPIMERIQARRGSGTPLPAAVQRQLEAGLNHDLSGVRIHADTEADLLSKKVNAVAFTTGQDIYFQSGKFDPNSQTGVELLAHEATHTVQQSKGQVGKGIDPDAGLEAQARQMGAKIASSVSPSGRQGARPVQRHRTGVSATFTPSTTFQRKAGGAPTTPPVLSVGKLGVIKQADGANVHTVPKPSSGLVVPQPVALGTRVGIISQTADGWSRISLASGKSGYIQTARVTTDLPDSGASLIRVTGGQTAIGVAERYYKDLVKPGQDLRYYVNVLEYVDKQRGTGAFQGGQTLKAGTVLWIPGPQMAQSLVGQVGSGSITGGRWAEAKNAVGNGPGANILRSVMESPQYIGEVLGETWKTVKEHWPVLLATTVAMVGAEFLVGALAAVPEPTMLTKVLAVGLQGMITAIAGGFAIAAGYAAIKAGQRWLTLAWTAKGDAGKLKAASKAFLGMIGDLVLLVASAAGIKTSAQKTAMFAKAPVKGMNVAAPARALTATRAGPALPKTANPANDFLYNKYWKNLDERAFAESPAEIARLRKALPPLKNLSDSEIIAIRQYTTRAYVPLNGALRAGTDAAELSATNSFISTRFNMPPVTTADADVLAQEILVGLGKLPAYTGKAFRGEGLQRLPMFQAMKPGDVWVEKAFLSSAYSPAGAMQKEMAFSLTSKSGVVIDKVSVVPHELEVLFKPGSKFKLVSIGQDKMTGKWEIVAEEQ
ncbi:eCIS core domain-containing protein [Deinococcus sp. UYEF24]